MSRDAQKHNESYIIYDPKTPTMTPAIWMAHLLRDLLQMTKVCFYFQYFVFFGGAGRNVITTCVVAFPGFNQDFMHGIHRENSSFFRDS